MRHHIKSQSNGLSLSTNIGLMRVWAHFQFTIQSSTTIHDDITISYECMRASLYNYIAYEYTNNCSVKIISIIIANTHPADHWRRRMSSPGMQRISPLSLMTPEINCRCAANCVPYKWRDRRVYCRRPIEKSALTGRCLRGVVCIPRVSMKWDEGGQKENQRENLLCHSVQNAYEHKYLCIWAIKYVSWNDMWDMRR